MLHFYQHRTRKEKYPTLTVFYIAVAIAAVIAAVAFISCRIRVTETRIRSSKLPDAFDGYRIVLLTDLHDRYFSVIPEKLRQLHPDAVMLGGDIHSKRKLDGEFFEFLTSLCGEYEVFFAEGNHDLTPDTAEDYREYTEKINATGVHLLRSDEVILRRGKDSVSVSGTDWYRCGNEYPIHSPGLFSIDLLHDPEFFDQVPSRPDLMLSGHVHGGFVRIPFVGGLIRPGAVESLKKGNFSRIFLPTYSEGLYCSADGSSRLFVSVGMGFSGLPFRLIPPEISLIILEKEPDSP